MYDDEGEVIEQSDLDDTLRNAAAAQAAADAFNAAQTSVVATSDQGGELAMGAGCKEAEGWEEERVCSIGWIPAGIKLEGRMV